MKITLVEDTGKQVPYLTCNQNWFGHNAMKEPWSQVWEIRSVLILALKIIIVVQKCFFHERYLIQIFFFSAKNTEIFILLFFLLISGSCIIDDFFFIQDGYCLNARTIKTASKILVLFESAYVFGRDKPSIIAIIFSFFFFYFGKKILKTFMFHLFSIVTCK